VNNYRCLVAFEMNFDSMGALCGTNGTGKSSVFDAIKFIRDMATGNCFLGKPWDDNRTAVSRLEFTHWLDSTTQEFEIEIKTDNHRFRYAFFKVVCP
jgi:AAA15 family ATPase/GTPase